MHLSHLITYSLIYLLKTLIIIIMIDICQIMSIIIIPPMRIFSVFLSFNCFFLFVLSSLFVPARRLKEGRAGSFGAAVLWQRFKIFPPCRLACAFFLRNRLRQVNLPDNVEVNIDFLSPVQTVPAFVRFNVS